MCCFRVPLCLHVHVCVIIFPFYVPIFATFVRAVGVCVCVFMSVCVNTALHVCICMQTFPCLCERAPVCAHVYIYVIVSPLHSRMSACFCASNTPSPSFRVHHTAVRSVSVATLCVLLFSLPLVSLPPGPLHSHSRSLLLDTTYLLAAPFPR